MTFLTMQPLRRGADGIAVADVRRMLASLGLLDNTDPQTQSSYDEATELAIRHFQQRRGMSVNGVVGTETYTALTEAHWRLGDRVLAHEPGQLLTGDDVSSLQTQLLELGYDLARADGDDPADRQEDAATTRDLDHHTDDAGRCGPAVDDDHVADPAEPVALPVEHRAPGQAGHEDARRVHAPRVGRVGGFLVGLRRSAS